MTEHPEPTIATSVHRANRRPLWRGAIGGAIGGLIHIFVIPVVNGDRPLQSYFLFFALVYLFPYSGLTGAVIGTVIRGLNGKLQNGLGPLSRAVLGILCAAVLGVIFSALMNESTVAMTNPARYLLGLAEYGILVGALAGVAAGK